MNATYSEALRLLGFSSDSQDGLPPADAIRRAFRQKALLWHPDKHPIPVNDVELDGALPPPLVPAASPHRHDEPQALTAGTCDGTAAAAAAAAANGSYSATLEPKPLSQSNPAPHPHPQCHQTQYRPTQAQAAEHFKRLASAYHILLQASASASSAAGRCDAQWSAGGAAGPASSGWPRRGGAVHPHSQSWEGTAAQQEAEEEEEFLDELSTELLLMEAHKMRLSDFDMVFLHQRACGAGTAVSDVWPEAVRSVEDVWRRIRRRVERQRKRRRGADGSGSGSGSFHGMYDAYVGSSRTTVPAVGAKWALLSEFLADIVGAPREPNQTQSTAAVSEAVSNTFSDTTLTEPGGSESVNCTVDLDREICCQPGPQQERQQTQVQEEQGGNLTVAAHVGGGGAVVSAAPASPSPCRQRGRLPAGFYWRWLKRLVAARLLFFVFFKG